MTPQNKGTVSSLLRQHYERILYPFDVFLSGATIGGDPRIPGVKMEFHYPTSNLTSNSNENNSNASSNFSQSNDSNSKDGSSANDVGMKQENTNDDSQASSDTSRMFSTPIKDQIKNSSSSSISSPTSNVSHQRLFSKPEKTETKPTRTSPRRIERPITYNVNIDLSKQLKLARKEPTFHHTAPSTPSSLHKIVDLSQSDASDCQEPKESHKCPDQTDTIQLRPSPRRQTRRMQSRSSTRSTFLRVDKGIVAFESPSCGNENDCSIHLCFYNHADLISKLFILIFCLLLF